MAALVVLKRKSAAVLPPDRPREAVGIRKQRVIDFDLLFRRDLKQHWLGDVQRVSGLGVLTREMLWLKLVGGRRLDIVYFAAVARPHAIRHEVPGIGRPGDGLQR